MTLEEIKEAVEVIKAYRQRLTDSVSTLLDGDIKAFDIAVEAMERESCGDCVSRQAVLDAMRKNYRSGGRDIDGDYVEGNYSENLYTDIISLPPVNPQRTEAGKKNPQESEGEDGNI